MKKEGEGMEEKEIEKSDTSTLGQEALWWDLGPPPPLAMTKMNVTDLL